MKYNCVCVCASTSVFGEVRQMNRLCFVWSFLRFERYSRVDQRLDARRCSCVSVGVVVCFKCAPGVYGGQTQMDSWCFSGAKSLPSTKHTHIYTHVSHPPSTTDKRPLKHSWFIRSKTPNQGCARTHMNTHTHAQIKLYLFQLQWQTSEKVRRDSLIRP